jgi:hypothetical protein
MSFFKKHTFKKHTLFLIMGLMTLSSFQYDKGKINMNDQQEPFEISLRVFDSYLKKSIYIMTQDSSVYLDSANSKLLLLMANTIRYEEQKINIKPFKRVRNRRLKTFNNLFYIEGRFKQITIKYGELFPLFFPKFNIYVPPIYNEESKFTIK